jgi:poly-gamma-glutamate synthesis protein (capsule biosynthesis protein)
VGVTVPEGAPLAALGPLLDALKSAGIEAEQVLQDADLELTPGAGSISWERVFTPVDRMSSMLDSITLDELKAVWAGTGQTPNFSNIYVAEDDVPELTALLGQPSANVKLTPADGVEAAVWGDKMGLGIVPFDQLRVKLRAIKLDGATPVDNRFVAADWPLASRVTLAAKTPRGEEALAAAGSAAYSNREPGKMTVLVMTGVTAMARNSAVAIERSGDYGFLGRLVGPELAAADITVISNEIPFAPDCVADNSLNNLLLCSKPEYWENLALSGVDVIGLSGNHMNDFGYDNFRWTLDLYKEKGTPYYAGGLNDKEARQPLILEQNGNRLGFLGANSWGPEAYWNGKGEQVSAWAGPDNPGAARFDLATMQADIKALRPQVELLFGEVQHTEFNEAGDYQTEPIPQQEADFRGMIDAGADVVTGVMAHAPQAVETRDGKLILYGLGNLYFDQTWSWPTRTGLVARHTIYDGKLINTELLVTVIEKNFQLRWATPAERNQVLKSVFDVSRWN